MLPRKGRIPSPQRTRGPPLEPPEHTVLDVGGADGLVSDMISWMASRSFSLCRGLLMPISRWISVSDRADMIAPLFTFARQAATYQAGIPTQSWREWSRQCQHRAEHQGAPCRAQAPGSTPSTRTSSHTTTVGPSHCANGKPCRRASSSNSCLQTRRQTWRC